MGAVVEIEGLTKRFGHVAALDGLDMRVERGQIHGFLGPNGSGKSTTIRVLLGMQRASGGRVRVFGMDPWHDAVTIHRRVAYVPGDVALWPNLTAGEVVDLLSALRGGVDRARRDALVEAFELDTRKRCRTLSKGNRQKVALVAALATPCELLVLDEPTSGLDPLMERVFVQHVRRAREQDGTTVLLSSHILSEVDTLCDHVSIIRDGRLVEHGSLEQLRHLTRTRVEAVTRVAPDGFDAIAGVHDLERDGRQVRMLVDTAALDPVLAQLVERGIDSVTCTPPTLEDLFLSHYDSTAG